MPTMRQPENHRCIPKPPAFCAVLCAYAFALPVMAVDYVKDIKPLLKERCISCHGTVKQKGDLRLDAGALIQKDVHHD